MFDPKLPSFSEVVSLAGPRKSQRLYQILVACIACAPVCFARLMIRRLGLALLTILSLVVLPLGTCVRRGYPCHHGSEVRQCRRHRCINLGSLSKAASRGAVLLSLFKRRRFPVEIILLCVRWYCKYGISYRDLAEMMPERGVEVDPSTIFRWVQRYAPELEKRVRRYQGHGPAHGEWMRLMCGSVEVEVPVPGRRQARPVDRLHAVRSAEHPSGLSLPAQSFEDDERLSAILDHD